MIPETLQERFARLRRELTARADPAVLDRPLSKWVNATDRHLPQGLVVRSVRELVAYTYDHLAGTPGIGRQRLVKLFDVLERVGTPSMSPVEESPRPAVPAPLIAAAAAVLPDEVTEPVWRVWCGLIVAVR